MPGKDGEEQTFCLFLSLQPFLLRSSVLKLNFFSSDFLNFDFFIARNRRGRRKKDITLSKTRELGSAIESEQLSEFTEEEVGINEGMCIL